MKEGKKAGDGRKAKEGRRRKESKGRTGGRKGGWRVNGGSCMKERKGNRDVKENENEGRHR